MAKKEQIGDVPGNILGMLADLNHKLQHGKITPGQLDRFLKKENPYDVTITEKDEVLSVTVNRDRTIAEGIKAGEYNWSNDSINDKNFKRTGKGTEVTEIILVHFDKSMSTDKALKELEKRNLRPADLQELLAIGEQHPDKQRQFPIIALGSVWQNPVGNRLVPFLGRNDSRRGLNLDWVGGDWRDVCRFAAVRK